jgi:hypothetical protein
MKYLSKSSFIQGLQCEKALYLKKNHYELADPITSQQQSIFNLGNKVGQYAQGLFPGGVNLATKDYTKQFEAIAKTKQLIDQGVEIIYEAGFCVDHLICFVDILVKNGDQWEIYEVKSSTKVSSTNIFDASLQYYILSKSGLKIKDVFITHIDNTYVREEIFFLEKLFRSTSVLEKVLERQDFIDTKIDALHKVLQSSSIPDVNIGSHCNYPYKCIFKSFCWKHIPEYSVFDVSRLSPELKWDLYESGILDLKDIPKTFPLSFNQQMEKDTFVEDKIHIDKVNLQNFFSEISNEIYFLDFETYQSVIPNLIGTKPYQQIPFQYSVHFMDANSQIIHNEFLAHHGKDPRESFIVSLINDLKLPGDIFVYNISFEKNRLLELALAFPNYKQELNSIVDRMIDLIIPFKQRWYYSPKMKGKNSIKNVLPALVPGFSYDDLEINNGILASQSFLNLSDVKDENQVEIIRNNLLEYCKLDTLAMVKIFEVLKSNI